MKDGETVLSIQSPSEETFHAHVMSEYLECGPLATDKPCHDLAARWNRHCTAAERIRETGQPLECGTGTREDAYCIWHSDGAVEAKNATCSDRKGERQ